MSPYHQLTLEQRYLIQTLHQQKKTQTYIAQQAGVSQATISRELARFKTAYPDQPYQAASAQAKATQPPDKHPYKLKETLLNWVQDRLRDRWSPEQICGVLAQPRQTPDVPPGRLHHETVYRYVYRQSKAKFAGSEPLTQYLRIRHRSRYKKRGQTLVRQTIPNRVGIEQRPAIVETNTELGHFEGDTIVGKGQQGYLLTLVERVTKYVLIVKLASKNARDLAKVAARVLHKSGIPLKSITFDNGTEFAQHGYLTSQLDVPVYFARPYHSWERGLNENTNGLIRQYIPKSCPISIVRPTDVSWIQEELNNRPRKTLGYQTPVQALKSHLYALQM
jgi:transposase, IS30 family